MPAQVNVVSGKLTIDQNFSVSLSGAGARDERVVHAVDRIFPAIYRIAGIPILPHVVPANQDAVLNIVVESADHRAPQKLGDNERYSLTVTQSHIRLSADAPLGALRGIQTFLQLIQQNTGAGSEPGFSVPDVSIQDSPRFPWRGLCLDVSRHFIPLDGVKRTLDGMEAVKLNVFHWHLSDDQGFRVESRRYPQLQRLGSDGMYYTQAQVRDVLAYARERGIRVIPEFDMPGHVTSFLPGYPVLGAGNGHYSIARGNGVLNDLFDPTKESTYRFLDGFIAEMTKLFPDEYFHIGGDEVDPKQWNDNPAIQSFMQKHQLADAKALHTYFNQRLLKIVTKNHKHMEGWDEIYQPNLPKSIVIQSWRGQKSLWQAARDGYQGILSAGYYLDLMYPASYHYSIDPMKPPIPAPRNGDNDDESKPNNTPMTFDLTPAQQKLILGGEAGMWEELVTSENLDTRLWPRLAVIAERLWSPESLDDIPSMYRRLEVTSRWLQAIGTTQRWTSESMLQRLAGTMPYAPLQAFSSVLEPVKGYSRHAEQYNILTPLNRLVDAIMPESDAAREFRNNVDTYVAGTHNPANSQALRASLTRMAQSVTAVRPLLQTNSLLKEDIAVADSLDALCSVGQEAIAVLDGTHDAKLSSGANDQVASAAKPQADMLIMIAPGIRKLVDAAQSASH
jgi:hexosaminidase